MRGIGQIDIGAMSKSRSMSASPTWVRGRGCRSPALPRHSDHGAPSIAISASTKVWLNDAVAPTRVEHLADVAEQRDAGILVVETGRQRDGGLTSLPAPFMTAGVGDAD